MFSVGMFAALALAGHSVQEPAQQTPPTEPAATVDDIIVHGARLEELAREFVAEVSAPARNRGLARWNRRVCVGVVNFRHDAAQYIADRVSSVAADLNLRTGDPGCRPNVIIIGAVDGAALAQRFFKDRPRLLVVGGGGMDRGYNALDDFTHGDRPVRWWHISIPVDTYTGQRAVRLPGDTGPIMIPVLTRSGYRSQIRDDLVRVMIIVDVDQASGVSLTQLADYLTLLALSQVDPGAGAESFDTILNLFDEPSPAAGLTEWDMAYLQALYGARNQRVIGPDQADAIVRILSQGRQDGAGE